MRGGISVTKGKITGGGKKQTVPVPDATDVRKVVKDIDAPDISSGKYSLYGEITEGDGKAYKRFLKDGSQEGLTQAQIIGIYKADKQAALNAISQNAVSGRGVEGSSNSGLTKSKIEDIVNTPKGSRPDPFSYLSQELLR